MLESWWFAKSLQRARYGEGQIWDLLEWLHVQNQISESLQGGEPRNKVRSNETVLH